MRTRRRATSEDLRLAIDCLPRATRIAMLEGIRSNDIIVGAYSDHNGICPMLAAHRYGGRTSLIAFAHAWDRFAFRTSKTRRARRATDRELLVLTAHLKASLLRDESLSAEVARALAEHRDLVARTAAETSCGRSRNPLSARPGDPDRSRELRSRPGWAWLRPVRSYDEYQRAVQRLRKDPDRSTESV